jgi:hypothetical protein
MFLGHFFLIRYGDQFRNNVALCFLQSCQRATRGDSNRLDSTQLKAV